MAGKDWERAGGSTVALCDLYTKKGNFNDQTKDVMLGYSNKQRIHFG
jgi:hypothetical protein